MYRIDYADLRSAAEIIYCFMTMPKRFLSFLSLNIIEYFT